MAQHNAKMLSVYGSLTRVFERKLARKFRSSLRPLSSKPKEWQLSSKWHWHLKIRPILLRTAAVICAMLSLLIVWSEVTYNHTNPVLSVIGLLVQLARNRVSYGAIEVNYSQCALSFRKKFVHTLTIILSLSLSIGDQFPDYALHVYLRLHYVDEDETPKQLCPGTKSPYG